MPSSTIVRLLAAIVLGVPALALLVPRLFPGVRISHWFPSGRRAYRRERAANMALVAAYHAHLPIRDLIDALDDRTWQDLDLDEVFVSLDHTRSVPGRQYLYHLLRTPRSASAPLERLERALHRLANDDDTAARVRTSLGMLDDPRAGQLVHLVFGDLPRRPLLWWIFPLLTASSIACLALIAVWPRAFIVWLGVCVVNVGVQLFYKPRVKRFVPALHEVPAFVRAARTLGTLDLPEADAEIRCLPGRHAGHVRGDRIPRRGAIHHRMAQHTPRVDDARIHRSAEGTPR